MFSPTLGISPRVSDDSRLFSTVNVPPVVLNKLILLRRSCEIAFIVVFTFARNARCAHTHTRIRSSRFTHVTSRYLPVGVYSQVGFSVTAIAVALCHFPFSFFILPFPLPPIPNPTTTGNYFLQLFYHSLSLFRYVSLHPSPRSSSIMLSVSFKSSTISSSGVGAHFSSDAGVYNLASEALLCTPQSTDGTKETCAMCPWWVSTISTDLNIYKAVSFCFALVVFKWSLTPRPPKTPLLFCPSPPSLINLIWSSDLLSNGLKWSPRRGFPICKRKEEKKQHLQPLSVKNITI